ncbi:MAG: TIGR00303 family protein [Synechococcales cyanobacterium CRU_2_2]|nr:TIGR00303 family protein [Synechococcales cyanobacterium CRU_2_2]
MDDVLIYGEVERAQVWMERVHEQPWSLVCTLGFTETALIPGISAAGKTPEDRRWTAIADSEFLSQGLAPRPAMDTDSYPLPPLAAGLSPVVITRALVEAGQIPLKIFNAGLPIASSGTGFDLQGQPAACLSSGRALALADVKHLFEAGLDWGQRLATAAPDRYFVLGECVVGGTTTALGILTGLGIAAEGRVNSSHPRCNHAQKQALVDQGLSARFGNCRFGDRLSSLSPSPLEIVAAVGDPMQPFVAGLAIAASRTLSILLAGGTQMLAVYALAAALAQDQHLAWNPENIAVGTTRWVAADPSGDTPGLAQAIGQRFWPPPILLATALEFSASPHAALRAYEAGFVKEGVAAGGSAIATCLTRGISSEQLRREIDEFCDRYYQWRSGHN